MGAWCGLLALTMISKELYDYRKCLRDANNSWCRFKIENSRKF